MSWRLKKQLIYGFIFLILLAIFITGLIFIFKPKPTCFDNKQNQGETGIDCGGPCLPCELVNLNLIIEKPKLIIYSDNTLDIVAKIKNPSEKYGLKKFSYKFIIRGDGVFAEIPGESFIFPLETKYLLVVNKKVPNFEIKSIDLNIDFNKNDWVETEKKETKVEMLNYQIDQNKLQVEIINNDSLPYSNIEINFLLLDIFENIIATAKTKVDYLEPLERRMITLNLPPVGSEVNRVIIVPYYNFFEENEN